MESKFVLLLCFSFIIPLYHVTSSTTTPQKPLKFSMKPMHRKPPRMAGKLDDIRGDMIPNKLSIAMLVNVSFGNPPVEQLLLMDTASDIVWTQCIHCERCFKQPSPLFNPFKSSTYEVMRCGNKFCKHPLECSFFRNECIYHTSYIDGSYSHGSLGTERLTFKGSNDRTVSVDNVIFGCGLKNNMTPAGGGESGILGLSPEELSLASQKGRKFSYCIGDLTDDSYSYNQLIVGEGAKMAGKSTPLEVYDDRYFLTLTGISVDDVLLDLDPSIFKRSFFGGSGGVVIDSGTTHTYIPQRAFDKLKEKLSSKIDPLMTRRKSGPNFLCYWGTLSQFIRGFPVVYFHFADNVDLAFDKTSLFWEYDEDSICMSIRSVGNSGGRYIIGLMAQQFHNVGFDRDAGKLYLQYGDCSLWY